MQFNKILFYFIIFYFLGNTTYAQTNKKANKPLKILSWNIYLLPAVTALSKQVGRTQKMPRTKGIIEFTKAENYDIIVWQETFNPFLRRKLKRKLKKDYPFQYGPANKAIFPKTNSGITIFSKKELKELAQIKYKSKSGIDGIANKGALLLEGKWGNKPFQILGTHLQAGGDDTIRIEQMKQIKELLDKYETENTIQIICGDFNTRKKGTEYPKMIKTLDVSEYELQKSEGSTYRISESDKGSEIDYIFVKPQGTTLSKATQSLVIPEIEWGENGEKWLSDHHAIELIINF